MEKSAKAQKSQVLTHLWGYELEIAEKPPFQRQDAPLFSVIAAISALLRAEKG
jgi:hypothetical protein